MQGRNELIREEGVGARDKDSGAQVLDESEKGTSDGNLVSYSATAAPLWASRGETTLVEGRQLDRGQALASADGRYRAVYQNDGNLVEYDGQGRAVWHSR